MASRRWADLRGFALFRRPGFVVLVLQPNQGKPVFVGVPLTVSLVELSSFLRGRGLEQQFDGESRPPHLAPAKT